MNNKCYFRNKIIVDFLQEILMDINKWGGTIPMVLFLGW